VSRRINKVFCIYTPYAILYTYTFIYMQHLKQEKTFVLVKPDGVKKGLIGEVIRRFEQRDLKIVAMSKKISAPPTSCASARPCAAG